MKKITFILLILAALIYTSPSVFAAKHIGSSSNIEKTMTYREDVNIGSSFTAEESLIIHGDLMLGSMATINKDLIVYGNLRTGSSINVGGDIIVTGNVKIGSSSNITGDLKGKNISLGSMIDASKIYASGNLTIGSSSDIAKGVEVQGNLNVGSSMDFKGYSKVTGTVTIGSMSNIEGTFYAYKNINFGSSIDLDPSKVKIVDQISLGSSSDINTRLYVFGEKKYGSMIDENLRNYTGLFGKIDPLLIYTLPESKIVEIKTQTSSYLQKISILDKQISTLMLEQNKNNDIITQKKSDRYTVYMNLFRYLQVYIENETFDQNMFNNIKQSYIGNTQLETTPNQINSINVIEEPIIKYTPFLPQTLKQRLDQLISNIPEEKRTDTLKSISRKISSLANELSREKQTDSTIRKINILLGIQEYMIKSISDMNSDENILRELGL